ncbi:MAG: histidine kinase dimerization/phospho-acceptor domain-containing protein, partial [Pseudomonadota bacterium]
MRVDLRARLIRAFFVQTGLIILTAILGTLAAATVLEEVLIKRALEDEATHFWSRFETNQQFARPDTRNLRGYLLGPSQSDPLPESLVGLSPGFHRLESLDSFSVAYVTENANHQLLLTFDGERVGELALYFGLVPLGCALVVLYLAAWAAYRLTRRAVSPIVWLADQVRKLDPATDTSLNLSPNTMPGTANEEVIALSEALERLLRRIEELLERERNFTRDASHELRSPLTVVRLATGMLLSEQELPSAARNSVLRIQRASNDMEELVDAFLLLARESSDGITAESIRLNDVVAEEVERATPI